MSEARKMRNLRESRSVFATALVAVAAVFATVPAHADETSAPSKSVPAVEIRKVESSWDNLAELFLSGTPAAPFSEGSVFVVRGELANTSGTTVHHVTLRYELLDERGNVVADAEGFNRSAESMRPDEDGHVASDEVVPLAAGAVDTFRMVFFPDEIPAFREPRVRVAEVHAETTR